MVKIKHGGPLEIGDFIAVSNNNYLEFGWYCGQGRGTIQFYNYRSPAYYYKQYKEWQKNPGDITIYNAKRYEKEGLSTKLLHKSYIYGRSVLDTRVVKITDPESVFTDEDLISYQESREALIEMKFLKQ